MAAADLKLGKRLGVVHDRRTIHFADLLTGLPEPPARVTTGQGEPIRMYANDRYGDCTCASMAHGIDLHERATKQHEAQLTDEDVLAFYSLVTGFDPDDPSTDNGAYLLDVCNAMRHQGLGRQHDGSPHTIAAFARVNTSIPKHVQAAAYMFGGLYVGAGLPLSAQDQLDATERWMVTDSSRARFGSWGGHAMWLPGFNSNYVTLTTWGRRQKASWQWFSTYVNEAYVVITDDYLTADRTPRGFDVAALTRALDALKQQ